MTKLYAWCTETLMEHSLYALKVFSECFEDRFTSILAARLCLSRRASPLLRGLGRLAVALHDIGKAHPTYQRTVKAKGGCPHDRGSCSNCDLAPKFRFHEALSAYVLWQIYPIFRQQLLEAGMETELLDEEHLVSDLWKIFTLAVIQHHQAMRGVSEIVSQQLYWGLKYRDEVGEMPSLLRGLLEISLNPVFPTVASEIAEKCSLSFPARWPSWQEVKSRLKNFLLGNSVGRLKLYSIFSGPLYVCDNLSARAHRPREALRKIVREALRSYPCLSRF